MYALITTEKCGTTLIPDWWADISKNGQKPHLKPETLDNLTNYYHGMTDGGASFSNYLQV